MDFNEQLFIIVLCDYYLDKKNSLKPVLLLHTTFFLPPILGGKRKGGKNK